MTIHSIDTLEAALAHSIDYLNSSIAIDSLKADPYWPKWNSPWWHMTLLWEIGAARHIPQSVIEAVVASLNDNCLKFFSFKLEELPEGIDPYRGVPCHCQLGTIYQVLSACGVDVDATLPWIRPWFIKYQLPDGGLNCDEAAYTKPIKRSSVVSTLPPLEATLFYTNRDFTSEEMNFLDRGAQYLIDRKLFRSVSKDGKIIDEDWLRICFPRFYDYDVLRGLNFLLHWAERCKKQIPMDAISETLLLIDQRYPDGLVQSGRIGCAGDNTWVQDAGGNWSRCNVPSGFPLLNVVGRAAVASSFLSRQLRLSRDCLTRLAVF